MTDILIPKNNVIMDSQVLTTLQACPRLCDLRFNQLVVPAGGKSNSLECGTLVHVILEYYNRGLLQGMDRTAAITNGFLIGQLYIKGCPDCLDSTKVCQAHKNEWTGLKNTPEENTKKGKDSDETARIGWKWVLETMEQYFHYYRNDSWTLLSTEEVRGKLIYEDDSLRVIWKAKFDEIHDSPNGIIGTDHKTSKQRRDTLSLNNQFMGQNVLLNTRNVRIDKIGFQTSLKVEDKFTRVLVSYSSDRLAEWVNDIVPYYANMLVEYNKAGYFPPNYTHCENKYGYCSMKSICESDRGMREEVIKVEYVKGQIWDVNNDE